MKIDKEEDDVLKQIAERLPPINVHSCEKHRLKGSEILEWETITEIDGVPIDPEKWYMWNYPVITSMNHYKRMKNIWKDRSADRKMLGIYEYMKYIDTVIDRNLRDKLKVIPKVLESPPVVTTPLVRKSWIGKVNRCLKIFNGRLRMFWGLCPKCNSDAPQLYDCKVCNFYRTSDSGMPTKKTKQAWWKNFIAILNDEYI